MRDGRKTPKRTVQSSKGDLNENSTSETIQSLKVKNRELTSQNANTINFKRLGLTNLLERTSRRIVSEIVLTHHDKLSRLRLILRRGELPAIEESSGTDEKRDNVWAGKDANYHEDKKLQKAAIETPILTEICRNRKSIPAMYDHFRTAIVQDQLLIKFKKPEKPTLETYQISWTNDYCTELWSPFM
ncbi:hypothetical protein G9A89_014128 [Geosiphon pyriformis]|nr:hypothetical protein G9A89_014128 [Geosiphon pyriformis]